MLVLSQLASREFTEHIELTYKDGTVIKIHTIRAQGQRVQLGIDAPLTVTARRVKKEVGGAK